MKKYYTEKYAGSIFVVKAGGRIIADADARHSLLQNIQDLNNFGIKVLLIYGGGQAIDEGLARANIEPRKVNGRRITGKREIEVIKSVISGDLGYRISGTMAELGMYGFCLNGIPPSWTDIKFRERDNEDDYGYDGTITKVYKDEVRDAFENISFIACPCLGISTKNAVNINADDVAVTLASGAQSRKLIFLSDVDGVLIDGKTASYITDTQIPELIAQEIVTGGMRVKLENCLNALNSGVRRIHLLNGFRQDSLAKEIYSSVGPATMILKQECLPAYLEEMEK